MGGNGSRTILQLRRNQMLIDVNRALLGTALIINSTKNSVLDYRARARARHLSIVDIEGAAVGSVAVFDIESRRCLRK